MFCRMSIPDIARYVRYVISMTGIYKNLEFARFQTVKKRSFIVVTFQYMHTPPSASAFASVSEQRRCKGTHFHKKICLTEIISRCIVKT